MAKPSKPHKAAVRASRVATNSAMAVEMIDTVSREYTPLVEAAQDAAVCRFGRTDANCRCSGCELRAALEATV